jgi:hypothetical protein
MWHDLQATFENRGEKSGVEKFSVEARSNNVVERTVESLRTSF